ncbi:MAG: hypothetical protein DYG91_05855 [Chloroflexi bacterium CFX7]|nr:hypothetical protein [Chloroflexi bacterium CFX7]
MVGHDGAHGLVVLNLPAECVHVAHENEVEQVDGRVVDGDPGNAPLHAHRQGLEFVCHFLPSVAAL